jgi:hypothetical protein
MDSNRFICVIVDNKNNFECHKRIEQAHTL